MPLETHSCPINRTIKRDSHPDAVCSPHDISSRPSAAQKLDFPNLKAKGHLKLCSVLCLTQVEPQEIQVLHTSLLYPQNTMAPGKLSRFILPRAEKKQGNAVQEENSVCSPESETLRQLLFGHPQLSGLP